MGAAWEHAEHKVVIVGCGLSGIAAAVKLREAGIDATQSSVSRDLRELGIVKLASGYARPQAANGQDEADLPADFVRGIDTAGASLTVIHTATGAAHACAWATPLPWPRDSCPWRSPTSPKSTPPSEWNSSTCRPPNCCRVWKSAISTSR